METKTREQAIREIYGWVAVGHLQDWQNGLLSTQELNFKARGIKLEIERTLRP